MNKFKRVLALSIVFIFTVVAALPAQIFAATSPTVTVKFSGDKANSSVTAGKTAYITVAATLDKTQTSDTTIYYDRYINGKRVSQGDKIIVKKGQKTATTKVAIKTKTTDKTYGLMVGGGPGKFYGKTGDIKLASAPKDPIIVTTPGDKTGPVVSVKIDKKKGIYEGNKVDLILTAKDDHTPTDKIQMKLSNDKKFDNNRWQAFQSRVEKFTLDDNGTATVYVLFKDEAENYSSKSDTIPENKKVIAVVNKSKAEINKTDSRKVKLDMNYYKGVDQMLIDNYPDFRNHNKLYSSKKGWGKVKVGSKDWEKGLVDWQKASETKDWTLLPGQPGKSETKTVYVLFKDGTRVVYAGGKQGVAYKDSVTLVTKAVAPQEIAVKAVEINGIVTYGTPIKVTANFTNPANANFTMSYSPVYIKDSGEEAQPAVEIANQTGSKVEFELPAIAESTGAKSVKVTVNIVNASVPVDIDNGNNTETSEPEAIQKSGVDFKFDSVTVSAEKPNYVGYAANFRANYTLTGEGVFEGSYVKENLVKKQTTKNGKKVEQLVFEPVGTPTKFNINKDTNVSYFQVTDNAASVGVIRYKFVVNGETKVSAPLAVVSPVVSIKKVTSTPAVVLPDQDITARATIVNPTGAKLALSYQASYKVNGQWVKKDVKTAEFTSRTATNGSEIALSVGKLTAAEAASVTHVVVEVTITSAPSGVTINPKANKAKSNTIVVKRGTISGTADPSTDDALEAAIVGQKVTFEFNYHIEGTGTWPLSYTRYVNGTADKSSVGTRYVAPGGSKLTFDYVPTATGNVFYEFKLDGKTYKTAAVEVIKPTVEIETVTLTAPLYGSDLNVVAKVDNDYDVNFTILPELQLKKKDGTVTTQRLDAISVTKDTLVNGDTLNQTFAKIEDRNVVSVNVVMNIKNESGITVLGNAESGFFEIKEPVITPAPAGEAR